MHNNRFIKNFVAIFLLVIFALSNTPTRVLHQLFANHNDFVSNAFSDPNTPQLIVAGIDCHCQSNVVITPYTCGKVDLTNRILPCFAEYSIPEFPEFFYTHPVTFGLRGPPSIA